MLVTESGAIGTLDMDSMKLVVMDLPAFVNAVEAVAVLTLDVIWVVELVAVELDAFKVLGLGATTVLAVQIAAIIERNEPTASERDGYIQFYGGHGF